MWLNRLEKTGLIHDGLSALAICVFAAAMPSTARAQLLAPATTHPASNASSTAVQRSSMGNSRSATDPQVPLAEQALLGGPNDDDGDYLDRLGGPIDASSEQSGAKGLEPPTPTEALISDADDGTTKTGTGNASESDKRPSALGRRSTTSSAYAMPETSPARGLIASPGVLPFDGASVYPSPW
ncbi:hypothetical protein P3T24_002287 [Paraburkholderia sp. GAS33]|jgi:hypothetical protein|uniref:hypothetical protein n=1 Tax=Paraburkholderia sp. GAS33 TaxID=3035130 RepID=UPI003D1EE52A